MSEAAVCSAADVVIHHDQGGLDPVVQAFVRGQGAVFSLRSPQKETPSEDCAALIPFDDVSGVLDGHPVVGGRRQGFGQGKSIVHFRRRKFDRFAGGVDGRFHVAGAQHQLGFEPVGRAMVRHQPPGLFGRNPRRQTILPGLPQTGENVDDRLSRLALCVDDLRESTASLPIDIEMHAIDQHGCLTVGRFAVGRFITWAGV